MDWLEQYFEVPEWKTIQVADKTIINEWRDAVRNMTYDCDGVVIKADVIDRADRQERTPSRDIAVKPELQVAVSKVRKIAWDQSGSYLAPVAEIDPVQLEGTTVTRASLSNLNIMKKLGIEVGKTVSIVKRGLIIPYVQAVLD
jgi:DNA ligase (NAD+)